MGWRMFLRHQNPFIHGGELNPLDAGKYAEGGGRCLQQSSTGVVKGLRMMRMGGRGGGIQDSGTDLQNIYIYLIGFSLFTHCHIEPFTCEVS